jgi:AraC family transcriptional regulator
MTPTISAVRGQVRHGWRCASGDSLQLMAPSLTAQQISEHQHDDAHVILVLRGRYETQGRIHDCRTQGALLVLNPPQTVHSDRFAAGEVLPRLRFLSLSLSPRRWWDWQQRVELPRQPVAQARDDLKALAVSLLHEGPERIDELLLEALPPLAERTPASAPAWLGHARRLLREQVFDDAGRSCMADLAARLRVHPSTLSRVFSRHLGQAPLQYARALRLEKAVALLDGPLSLSELALACGFYDQAHFCRQFRRAYGRSPQAWRTRHKNVQDAVHGVR